LTRTGRIERIQIRTWGHDCYRGRIEGSRCKIKQNQEKPSGILPPHAGGGLPNLENCGCGGGAEAGVGFGEQTSPRDGRRSQPAPCAGAGRRGERNVWGKGGKEFCLQTRRGGGGGGEWMEMEPAKKMDAETGAGARGNLK
jgi:hypothetical protein